jgi:hypothetical protein
LPRPSPSNTLGRHRTIIQHEPAPCGQIRQVRVGYRAIVTLNDGVEEIRVLIVGDDGRVCVRVNQYPSGERFEPCANSCSRAVSDGPPS